MICLQNIVYVKHDQIGARLSVSLKPLVLLFLFISTCCFSQKTYNEVLASRLEAIRKLDVLDNGVVLYEASQGYGTTFPKWSDEVVYYQDDVVFNDQGKFYVALSDNLKGVKPGYFPDQWRPLKEEPRPYLFLRDSARTEDLFALLHDKHPYVKTYAFAALARKHRSELFDIIINNLSDTTQIDQIVSDYGYPVYPAELMIEYVKSDLTAEQKRELTALIQSKFKYLSRALETIDDK